MGAKCYRAMRRAEQRHSTLRIAKPPELSGLLPQLGTQFGTTSMKDDGGKRVDFAHVTFQKLHDVCRKAVFAHVNPMTKAKESILPTLRQQIHGGRKGHAERLGLGQRPHNIAKKSDRSAARASSDAGRRTAKRWPCAPVRTEA